MIIVSDTLVISNLIKLGEQELLYELFGQVIIPQVVHRKLLADKTIGSKIQNNSWIEVRKVINLSLYQLLLDKLVSEIGFRVKPTLYRKVLQLAGES